MSEVIGTLKYVSITKDRKRFTLTGEWNDEKNPEKQWVFLNELKPLKEVVSRPGTKGKFGEPLFTVFGEPTITLIKSWNKTEDRYDTVVAVGGEKPAARPSPNDTGSWAEVQATYEVCAQIAREVLGDVEGQALVRAANMIGMMAKDRGLRADTSPTDTPERKPTYEDFPEAQGEEDDDLPF